MGARDRGRTLEAAAASLAVTDIIGNDSWTRLQCAECKQSVQMLVTLEGYGGDDYQQICPDCLRKALIVVAYQICERFVKSKEV